MVYEKEFLFLVENGGSFLLVIKLGDILYVLAPFFPKVKNPELDDLALQ